MGNLGVDADVSLWCDGQFGADRIDAVSQFPLRDEGTRFAVRHPLGMHAVLRIKRRDIQHPLAPGRGDTNVLGTPVQRVMVDFGCVCMVWLQYSGTLELQH